MVVLFLLLCGEKLDICRRICGEYMNWPSDRERHTKKPAKKKDPSITTKEEFFSRVDEGREQIRSGEGIRFSSREEKNSWLNSL